MSKRALDGDAPKVPAAECTARLMDAEEAASISVNFADIEAKLPALMAEKGVAIVTNVLDTHGIAALEAALAQDLADLVDMLHRYDAELPAARAIARRGRSFALRMMSREASLDYVARALQAYHRLSTGGEVVEDLA